MLTSARSLQHVPKARWRPIFAEPNHWESMKILNLVSRTCTDQTERSHHKSRKSENIHLHWGLWQVGSLLFLSTLHITRLPSPRSHGWSDNCPNDLVRRREGHACRRWNIRRGEARLGEGDAGTFGLESSRNHPFSLRSWWRVENAFSTGKNEY